MTDETYTALQQTAARILDSLQETNARLDDLDHRAVTAEKLAPVRRSIARRNAASFLVGLVALLAVGNSYLDAARDREDRKREEAMVLERRIASRSQDYANCQENNRQNIASATTYENLFLAAASNPPSPDSPLTPAERRYNLSRSLDILRGEITVSDCESTLADLTDEQKARARDRAAGIPRSPLPPPDIPGYVPPTTTPGARP